MEINERFKLIRKQLGFTQKSFASELNKTEMMIQYYEYGKRNITLKLALELQQKFNINSDWLINGTGSMFLDEKEKSNVKIDWLINGNGSMFLSENEKKADSGVVSTASSYNVPERLLILLSKLKKEDLIRVEGYMQAIVDSYKNKDMQKLSS